MTKGSLDRRRVTFYKELRRFVCEAPAYPSSDEAIRRVCARQQAKEYLAEQQEILGESLVGGRVYQRGVVPAEMCRNCKVVNGPCSRIFEVRVQFYRVNQ